jgi:hypothetical protein
MGSANSATARTITPMASNAMPTVLKFLICVTS